jgi:MFS family permease
MRQIGEVFAFIGFIGIVVQGGLLRQLLKRQSEKSLAVTGAVLLVVGMALLPQVGGLVALLGVSAVIGIGNSLVTPTLNGLASRSAERSWQGRVVGLMQSSGSLARCLGPFVAGKLLSMDVGKPLAYYGRTPCWVASLILCISLILILQLPSKPITATA